MCAGPKNLATSEAVGGTVARKVRPMTAAKTSTTTSVLGASTNSSTATARAAYSNDNSDFARQRPIAQPMPKLPMMLNRPTIASAQAPTAGGRPQAATTPGRCVAMNATWKPQTKKPALSSR